MESSATKKTSTTTSATTTTSSSCSSVVADDFLSLLSQEVPLFVQSVEEQLSVQYQLDVSTYEADHVCWRTESLEDDYIPLVEALMQDGSRCELLVESTVGGRPIATFRLRQGIKVPRSENRQKSRTIQVVEIPAPKPGKFYARGLEHVEFVISSNHTIATPVNDEHQNNHEPILEEFMKQHNNDMISWNTKAKNKSVNPDVSFPIDLTEFGTCSVKFHLFPLAHVIDYETKHGLLESGTS